MSVKLNDAQLVMMSAAAQRKDRCLAAPEMLKGAAVGKVSAKLVKLGLAREVPANSGMPIWRRDKAGLALVLKLTAAGLSDRCRRRIGRGGRAERDGAAAAFFWGEDYW